MRKIIGVEIISDPLCILRDKQVRFPRSKKKRIRNKWTKLDKNWNFKPGAFWCADIQKFIAHPSIVARLEKEIYAQNKNTIPKEATKTSSSFIATNPAIQTGATFGR